MKKKHPSNDLPASDSLWMLPDTDEAKDDFGLAERRIQHMVRRKFWLFFPLIAVLSLLLGAGAYAALRWAAELLAIERYVEQLDGVFAWMDFLAAVAALCVALASAVVTYFFAMLAYRLAAQAKRISQDTLDISKRMLELSQRESLRESAKHAVQVRSALQGFARLASQYVTAVKPASLHMYWGGQRHLVLLQWYLECQALGEVYDERLEHSYAKKKALLMPLVQQQLEHAMQMDAVDDENAVLWQRLLEALQADALGETLSMQVVLGCWGEAQQWERALQGIRTVLDESMQMLNVVYGDAMLLDLWKADPQREHALSVLYERHRVLHQYFAQDVAKEEQLVAVLRANALATAYFRRSWGSDIAWDEVLAYGPWMGLLSQGDSTDRNFYLRSEIGIESVREEMLHFLSVVHVTQEQIANIFHLEAKSSDDLHLGSRFLLPYAAIENALNVWQRMQQCIAQTHAALPQVFDTPAEVDNLATALDAGIERWKALAQEAVHGL